MSAAHSKVLHDFHAAYAWGSLAEADYGQTQLEQHNS